MWHYLQTYHVIYDQSSEIINKNFSVSEKAAQTQMCIEIYLQSPSCCNEAAVIYFKVYFQSRNVALSMPSPSQK